MNFNQLITTLRNLNDSLKNQVIRSANTGLTLRNWIIGAYLVEFEQHGEERAQYGENLIPEISKSLNIRGLPPTTLRLCRTLYQSYPEIQQTVSGELAKTLNIDNLKIKQTLSVKSNRPDYAVPVKQLLEKLTFSHFIELLRIHTPQQRAFYEIECMKGHWSVRELKRQIGSLLYERLGLSTDKEKLLRLTSENAEITRATDIIKDPYVFEFLGLQPKEVFRENDLETALLDHLQEFLLELGNGFCFEDRQKKIRIGKADYFIDLVFYHRKLHCHVLIELKAEPFNHTNAGQLNTYINYYKKHEMAEGDNPPIGLLLCTDKDRALVEYALGGMDKNLFVSNYQVALPSKQELETFILQHA